MSSRTVKTRFGRDAAARRDDRTTRAWARLRLSGVAASPSPYPHGLILALADRAKTPAIGWISRLRTAPCKWRVSPVSAMCQRPEEGIGL